MKKLRSKTDNRIKVNYYQRRPREGFNFSLEYIFNNIRNKLIGKIDATLYFSIQYNDGYFSKFINIVQATLRPQNGVNHITGEVHFLNLFMRKNQVVLTIHDCGMMERKRGMAKKIVKWLYLIAPVSKAKWVTAVSEETKNQIVSYTSCNPDKIKVIPVAINPIYQPFPKKFNHLKPVLLQMGTGHNKNLLRLIEAIDGVTCHLSIVGKLSNDHIEALKAHKIDYSNWYDLSDAQLLDRYIECDIVCFISTFEGFGMPIVEANAVERVVITSNISSMPEVAGNAACLVNPYAIDEIRTSIFKIIDNNNYRENLIEEGKINKLRFDGDKIANMYYDLYRQISY